jgi:hypothetical protein
MIIRSLCYYSNNTFKVTPYNHHCVYVTSINGLKVPFELKHSIYGLPWYNGCVPANFGEAQMLLNDIQWHQNNNIMCTITRKDNQALVYTTL